MLVYLVPEDSDNGTPPGLSIGPFFVEAPTPQNQNPPQWWNLEAFTGIAAERVAKAWKSGRNKPLEDAAEMIATTVQQIQDNDFDSIESLRRYVVRFRFQQGIKPIVFVGRVDLLVPRVREILVDVMYNVLFTTSAAARLVPAMVVTVRGRAEMLRIDDVNKAKGVFLRTIRFARPGRLPKDADPSTRVPPTGAEPPPTIVNDFITFPPEWPELNGVLRIPSLRHDGTVSHTTGYDADAKVWYEPDPIFKDIVIPEDPGQEWIDWAKSVLLYPISQFPFVDGPGGAIAVLLERVAMRMLNGPRPLYVFDAPVPRTGKSLLAQMLASVLFGSESPTTSWPGGDDTELEKRITAILRAPDEVIFFDNIDDESVESAALARLTTSTTWRGRILGQTESLNMPNIVTWMLTLNNARLSKDLANRSVLVRLDTGHANPQGRTFELKAPLRYVIDHRAEMIQAAIILVRAWVVAGMPRDPALANVMGGFERWLHVVGGTLHFAGIPGLSESLIAATERETTKDDEEAMISLWRHSYGQNVIGTRAVLDLVRHHFLYEQKFEGVDPKGSWGERKMAEILRGVKHVRRVAQKPATWALID